MSEVANITEIRVIALQIAAILDLLEGTEVYALEGCRSQGKADELVCGCVGSHKIQQKDMLL